MKYILCCCVFYGSTLIVAQFSWADALSRYDFFQHVESDALWVTPDLEHIQLQDDNNNAHSKLNQRYIGEDPPKVESSILENNFYENERFRFYNQTRYDFENVKNKYTQGEMRQISFADLDVSFGYGMEFKLSAMQSIGYEYLSNFPSDYGQTVRFFWKKIF